MRFGTTFLTAAQGRATDVAIDCVKAIRERLPRAKISIECEKPRRPGLPELAAEGDFVFYSKDWAQVGDDGTYMVCPGKLANIVDISAESRLLICGTLLEARATQQGVGTPSILGTVASYPRANYYQQCSGFLRMGQPRLVRHVIS